MSDIEIEKEINACGSCADVAGLASLARRLHSDTVDLRAQLQAANARADKAEKEVEAWKLEQLDWEKWLEDAQDQRLAAVKERDAAVARAEAAEETLRIHLEWHKQVCPQTIESAERNDRLTREMYLAALAALRTAREALVAAEEYVHDYHPAVDSVSDRKRVRAAIETADATLTPIGRIEPIASQVPTSGSEARQCPKCLCPLCGLPVSDGCACSPEFSIPDPNTLPPADPIAKARETEDAQLWHAACSDRRCPYVFIATAYDDEPPALCPECAKNLDVAALAASHDKGETP